MAKKKELRSIINHLRGELAQARLDNHILTEQFQETTKGIEAEWMGVVAALSEIVAPIPCESTIKMVGRIQAEMAEAKRAMLGMMIFDCRCVGDCSCHSAEARKSLEDARAFLQRRP